jgi:hypothetical protein
MNNHVHWGKDFRVTQTNGMSDLWVRGEFNKPKLFLSPLFHWENSKENASFMAQNRERAINECAKCIESLLHDSLQGSGHMRENGTIEIRKKICL